MIIWLSPLDEHDGMMVFDYSFLKFQWYHNSRSVVIKSIHDQVIIQTEANSDTCNYCFNIDISVIDSVSMSSSSTCVLQILSGYRESVFAAVFLFPGM